MISGIKHQVHCCSALLWGLLMAESNYLMPAPWAFSMTAWIEPQSTGRSSGDIRSSFRTWTLRCSSQTCKTWCNKTHRRNVKFSYLSNLAQKGEASKGQASRTRWGVREIHGFHRHNPIFVAGHWRQLEEVARKKIVCIYGNTLQNQTGTKTWERG